MARSGDFTGLAEVVNFYIEEGTSHFGTTPMNLADVEAMATDPMHACFVARREGIVIGAAWSAAHKSREAYAWTVDVAVYLREGEGGAGLGTRLQARVVDCLRKQGYVSALAVIVCPNPASVRLHEGLGFKQVGIMPNMGFKQRRWHDVGVWHLALREPSESPPTLRSVADVLGS